MVNSKHEKLIPGFAVPGYQLRRGSMLDQARLVKVMQRAYRDLGAAAVEHLAETVQRHFSDQSKVWWVDPEVAMASGLTRQFAAVGLPGIIKSEAVGCLWLTQAVDQWTGVTQAYIFLIYVAPSHRRQGIGTALMKHAQTWAEAQGYPEIGLQVFQNNTPAIRLYERLGYTPRATWMTLKF